MNASGLRVANGSAIRFVFAVLLVACSSSTTPTPSLTFSTTAAVVGQDDGHCAGKVVTVSQAACLAPVPVTGDAGQGPDGGATDTPEYGPTQPGSEGDDDDCKYHAKWQSTPVAEGSDVTFQVVATVKKDGSALAGAKPYAEIFLNDSHPAPNTPVQTAEPVPGTYQIGPVRFDAPGNWNVRFHFNADCHDLAESPHAHAAFFVKVP